MQTVLPFLVAALGLAAGPALTEANPWQPHVAARMAVVGAQQALLGTGDVMLLGDSNTEMFWWNMIGSCQVLNAGFGGATIADIAALAPALAASARPRVVHVMLGTNDLRSASQEVLPAKRGAMMLIVEAFLAEGSVVVIWPVPPFAEGFSTPEARRRINGVLLSVAQETGAYWDWWWPNQIAQGPHLDGAVTDGPALPGSMLGDRVHFAPETQLSRLQRLETWQASIEAERAVACD